MDGKDHQPDLDSVKWQFSVVLSTMVHLARKLATFDREWIEMFAENMATRGDTFLNILDEPDSDLWLDAEGFLVSPQEIRDARTRDTAVAYQQIGEIIKRSVSR